MICSSFKLDLGQFDDLHVIVRFPRGFPCRPLWGLFLFHKCPAKLARTRLLQWDVRSLEKLGHVHLIDLLDSRSVVAGLLLDLA